MSRRARWVIGCVVLVVVVVGGCVALAYFALEYSRWKNCWFPPRDPDVEVVASACDDPVLGSVSPDGRFVLYGTHVSTDYQSWLLDVVSGEVRPSPGCGKWWLTNTLRLSSATTPVTDPLNGWTFTVCDMSDDSRTPLQWVQGLQDTILPQGGGDIEFNPKGTMYRREDNALVFSPEVMGWFRNAEWVYYIPTFRGLAIALTPDFKAHPEDNYVLALPRGGYSSYPGDETAILDFLEDNEIPYTEIAVRNQTPRSHDGRFIFRGRTIVDSAGTEVANYEYEGRWWGVGPPGWESGWAYDDSGVYFQLGRGGGGLFLFSPPGPIQPILKLKVPEAYLRPTATPAP